MDFLKTLLAYMAATFIVAVESTSTPAVTPVPTPAPATKAPAAAAEMITSAPSEEITATPTISVTPVPVPTITPNMKGYHNLLQGDRGEEVKKLQERLIELGYLPEGSADGAYGGQTRNAVRRFQYYNGLTVDGIAGRTTQTNLFENPDIAPMPTEEVSPTPTVAPVPTLPPDSADESDEKPEEHEKTEEDLKTNVPAVTPQATGTSVPTNTPEPTEAPVPTVTPYVVAAPTEIPWGDEAKELTAEGEEDAAGKKESEDSFSSAEAMNEAEEHKAEEEADHSTDELSGEEKPADTEIVEEVNLDEAEAGDTTKPPEEQERIEYHDLAGWIVLNDSEKALQWTVQEKGMTVVRSPRMERADDDIRISLDDMVQSVETWVLHDEGDSLILEAQGFTLALLNEETGFAAALDGLEMATDPLDFSFEEGHFIRVDFLTRALDGSWEWNEEEETLTLQIPEKGKSPNAE